MSTDSFPHAQAPGHLHEPEQRPLHSPTSPTAPRTEGVRSVLAWPAWLRMLAVMPLVVVLWLAVWWAHAGAALW